MDSAQRGAVPEWNSHLAALAAVCHAAGLQWNIAEIAGKTGLGFRTALCGRAAPQGLYHSWSFPHYFSGWLGGLGVTAQTAWYGADLPGAADWLEQCRSSIEQSLERGHCCIYWDQVAFSTIIGRAGDGFTTSGISGGAVHPVLLEQAGEFGFARRVVDNEAEPAPELQLSLDELSSSISSELFFACPIDTCNVDRQVVLPGGIRAAAMELRGRLEFPRHLHGEQSCGGVEYGVGALKRLIDELKRGNVHHFGLVQFVQSQAEARRWAAEFLRVAGEEMPRVYAPRVLQAGEFIDRSNAHWSMLAAKWKLPLDSESQMSSTELRTCAEMLYEIYRSESTAARLVCSVADELL